MENNKLKEKRETLNMDININSYFYSFVSIFN